MSPHIMRIRQTIPKRGAATLYRPICSCDERGPLTPSIQKANEWIAEHEEEVNA